MSSVRMSTLNGTVLRVATFLDNAYIYDVEVQKITHGQDVTLELVGGYAVSLLNELSHLLDFKLVELVVDPPNLVRNFSLAVRNYSIDLFASSFFLSEDRTRFSDPTFITGESRIQVFLNRAFQGSMNDVIVAPFTSTVWQLLAFAVLFLSVTFCFVAYHSEGVGYWSSLFQIISVFLLRDASLHVKSWSSRIIQLSASITIFLLISAYTAKIFEIGAVKVESIKTLAGLVTSIFDVSYDRGYGNRSVLQYNAESDTGNPIMSAIQVKAALSQFRYDTFESAMKEVISRPFAYIIDEETAFSATDRALGRLPCELGITSIYFAQYQWCMYTRKGFEHREEINSGILRLGEMGVLRKFARHWIPGRAVDSTTACSTGSFAQFSGVHLKQLKYAIIIFIAGGSCACFALILESLLRWFQHISIHSDHPVLIIQ